MACQAASMSEKESYPGSKSSLPGRHASLQDRRHGGGIGDDYDNDYGLAPPNPRTDTRNSEQGEGKWLKDQHQRRRSEIAKSNSYPKSVHSHEKENAGNGHINMSFPSEKCTESGSNGITWNNLPDHRSDTFVEDTDYSDEDRSDITEELRVTTPQFVKDSAVFRLTHNSGLRNNPKNLLSVDDFSQSLGKPNGLLYKRREHQGGYITSRNKPVRASNMFPTTGDARYINSQVGFQMEKRYPPSHVKDNYEPSLQRIGQRSRTTHHQSLNPVKPMLKSKTDLSSHHDDEFYNRFARQPRRSEASVKLPPISAASQMSTNSKEKRRTKTDVRFQLQFSEEFRSVVKALGD